MIVQTMIGIAGFTVGLTGLIVTAICNPAVMREHARREAEAAQQVVQQSVYKVIGQDKSTQGNNKSQQKKTSWHSRKLINERGVFKYAEYKGISMSDPKFYDENGFFRDPPEFYDENGVFRGPPTDNNN